MIKVIFFKLSLWTWYQNLQQPTVILAVSSLAIIFLNFKVIWMRLSIVRWRYWDSSYEVKLRAMWHVSSCWEILGAGLFSLREGKLSFDHFLQSLPLIPATWTIACQFLTLPDGHGNQDSGSFPVSKQSNLNRLSGFISTYCGVKSASWIIFVWGKRDGVGHSLFS